MMKIELGIIHRTRVEDAGDYAKSSVHVMAFGQRVLTTSDICKGSSYPIYLRSFPLFFFCQIVRLSSCDTEKKTQLVMLRYFDDDARFSLHKIIKAPYAG